MAACPTPRADLASASYVGARNGPYVNLGIVVDAQSKLPVKASSRDETGRMAIRAEHPLLAELNCGEKLNGVGYVIASKYYKLNIEKDAHMSYAPLIAGETGAKTCQVLINIVGADGRYIQHQFDTEIETTADGDRIYRFKPLAAGNGATPGSTQEIAKPR